MASILNNTIRRASSNNNIFCLPPQCRSPDKRDFMDFQPERSAVDFYRNYDPMIGIGTAAILLGFIFFITIKSIISYTIRRFQKVRYRHKLFSAAAAASAITNNVDNNNKSNENNFFIKVNKKKTVRSLSTSTFSNLTRYNFASQLNAQVGRLSLGAGLGLYSQNQYNKNKKNNKLKIMPLLNINCNNTLNSDASIDSTVNNEIGLLTSI